jgi:hypothetical protein
MNHVSHQTHLANGEMAAILDRSDREIILLALAELAKARPGWSPALGEIADKLDLAPSGYVVMSGIPRITARDMFEKFRDGEDFYKLKDIERALDGRRK